jgi:2-keto-4-pentenoate hydratase
MALTQDDIRLAARRLHQAEKTKQQIRQLSLEYPGITIDDSYAIQKAWIEIKVAEGRWIGALCYRNGQLEETGLAAGVLNHPATSVAWLANKIAPHGLALEKGQVVLAGSFIRPIETRKGDTIQVDYGPHGSVGCYFA